MKIVGCHVNSLFLTVYGMFVQCDMVCYHVIRVDSNAVTIPCVYSVMCYQLLSSLVIKETIKL